MGDVGCNPEEIAISNDNLGAGARTWNAECRGRQYICSAVNLGQGGEVSCKPVNGEAAATGGCQYDPQCKGDCICVSGACVDPMSRQ